MGQTIRNIDGVMRCRYCPATDQDTDIYLVFRNGHIEGFCLPCYEKHLDDKTVKAREAKDEGAKR